MIEAVDWRDYDSFFESMRRLLSDDGALAMQAIVVPDPSFDRLKRHTNFIKMELHRSRGHLVLGVDPGGRRAMMTESPRSRLRARLPDAGIAAFGRFLRPAEH
jgi:hypothetical protein